MFNNIGQQEEKETIKEEVPEIKKNLWSIDKFDEDGQVKAGEVDRQQEEFLKTTQWSR